MIFLLFFAFLGGIVTILSPCILPVLPIVLSGTLTGGKKKPLGVVTGFILSFTFFTLFLTTIVKATGVSADALRTISVLVIGTFGISLLLPKFQVTMEKLFSRLASIVPTQNKQNDRPDFIAGLFIGLSLGLIWTPCVGPILASIITLAATNQITINAIFITLAYATGTAIPMFAVIIGGRKFISSIKNPKRIQKAFGVLMVVAAIAIFMNWDRQFQVYILEKFPNYGANLTTFENNAFKTEEQKVSDAPELKLGGEWFNSPPLTMASLRGKVVFVDFWTYTCINCIRTFPYLKSWWEKYKDKGLVIIGVHTPEFAFEKNPRNVASALKDFGITYPVMQDNDFATWQAYDNHYWPAHYLIDKTGKIREQHIGEGDYDDTEKKIQELLSVDMPIDNPTYQVRAGSPETYLGSERTDRSRYTLTGSWSTSAQYAMPTRGATLTYRFDAEKVYLVMRPKNNPGKVKVYLDGTLQKEIIVDTDKLYTLIELAIPGTHTLKLEFLDENVELYAFTFG